MKNRSFITTILLTALCLYFGYYYFQNEVFVKVRNGNETEYHSEIHNPLTIVFLGRMKTGENSYAQYGVIGRILALVTLAWFTCLVVATIQYFATRYRKGKFLLFVLLTEIWIISSSLSIKFFYWLYDMMNTETELFTNSTLSLLGLARYALLLTVVGTVITLIIRSGNSEDIETTEVPIPSKWMRGFHFFTDRLLVFFLASNSFIFYYFNAPYSTQQLEGVGRDTLYFWSILSLTGCVVIAAFITESLFLLSPSKILTGTSVVSTDGSRPSTGKIIGRSLSRIIPFDSLSFLTKNGWHDSISKTTVVYTQQEPWLARQSRIVIAVSIVGLVFLTYLLVATVAMAIDMYTFGDFFSLPYVLTPITVIFMMAVITCWLASLSNFSENLYKREFSQSSKHLWTAFGLWVPVLNIRIASVLMNDITHNLMGSIQDEDRKQQMKIRVNSVKKSFIVMNIATLLGVFLLFNIEYRVEHAIAIGVFVFPAINWSIRMIRYARIIRSLAPELTNAYKEKLSEQVL